MKTFPEYIKAPFAGETKSSRFNFGDSSFKNICLHETGTKIMKMPASPNILSTGQTLSDEA